MLGLSVGVRLVRKESCWTLSDFWASGPFPTSWVQGGCASLPAPLFPPPLARRASFRGCIDLPLWGRWFDSFADLLKHARQMHLRVLPFWKHGPAVRWWTREGGGFHSVCPLLPGVRAAFLALCYVLPWLDTKVPECGSTSIYLYLCSWHTVGVGKCLFNERQTGRKERERGRKRGGKGKSWLMAVIKALTSCEVSKQNPIHRHTDCNMPIFLPTRFPFQSLLLTWIELSDHIGQFLRDVSLWILTRRILNQMALDINLFSII